MNQSSSTIGVISTQKKWALAVSDYTQAIAINPNYLLSYSDRSLFDNYLANLNKPRDNL
ncbi:hypothetical protein [Anabaenopsis elenkinii]|uniref:Tetratricopeptide repeat protein n=1 Tax=Anabaenopsis elenkinii CCIBt3563 TaxID=2779889 RepID=A0A7S6RD62_9CYAN|nr:hypothetical protein [Anabaenopsis elenkinii]QOV22779.1 hypothetical protein IM676_19445 [Anabaenopsis elenkinii CCIBt3563]